MKTTWQKAGFTVRLAKASDVDDYYFQNYCPLDKEVARLTGCKEHFTKEEMTSFFLKAIEETDRYFFLILDPNGKIIGESVINEIDWDLRRLIQRNITVIPKSVHQKRMAENIAVFDFELTQEEMQAIAGFDRNESQFFDHRDPKTIEQIFGSSLVAVKANEEN